MRAALAAARSAIVPWAAHVDRAAPLAGAGIVWTAAGRSGVIDDPSASPLAMAAVLDGRQLTRGALDLQAVIAVDDPVRSADLPLR